MSERLDIVRAIFLTRISRSKRRHVTVTYADYNLLFSGCERKRVIIDQHKKPLHVVMEKEKAMKYLQKQGQLYGRTMG